MKYDAEQLARMNRSGQRRGAVGSKPTVCTQTILHLAEQGTIRKDTPVLDFGAGKWAQQTAILRDEGFEDVTPYDIGANGNDVPPEPVGGWPVIMMSNVLNVQPTLRHIAELAATTWEMAAGLGLLVCNYPQSPRYSNATARQVTLELEAAGWERIGTYNGAWIFRARSMRP